MAGYPKELLEIVRREATKHVNNIDAAVDAAERRWKRSEDFPNWIEQMIRDHLRTMICDVRHSQNVTIRRQNGCYGQPAKVTLSTGAVNRVANNVLLSYAINGMSLGALTGKDLRELVESEKERAEGCEFNSRLCARLVPMVPEGKTVAQCIKPKEAARIFKELSMNRGTAKQRKSA